MATFAHAVISSVVLTSADVEGEARVEYFGTTPDDYTEPIAETVNHQISAMGGRGWEMFQIRTVPVSDGTVTEYWFRKRIA